MTEPERLTAADQDAFETACHLAFHEVAHPDTIAMDQRVTEPERTVGVGDALVHRDVGGMRDLVEGEVAGRFEGVHVSRGEALRLAHAAALRCRQTRKAISATTPAAAAAGPAVEITCSATWPRK